MKYDFQWEPQLPCLGMDGFWYGASTGLGKKFVTSVVLDHHPVKGTATMGLISMNKLGLSCTKLMATLNFSGLD